MWSTTETKPYKAAAIQVPYAMHQEWLYDPGYQIPTVNLSRLISISYNGIDVDKA